MTPGFLPDRNHDVAADRFDGVLPWTSPRGRRARGGPSARSGDRIVVREQRFGKSSTPQQDVQVRARRRAIQLAQGKRMQTKVAVAPGQGIAPLAVVIEAGGAGDDDAARGFLGVVDPLEQVRKKPIIVPFYS